MYMHCSSCTQWIWFSISIECDQLDSTRLESTRLVSMRCNAICLLSDLSDRTVCFYIPQIHTQAHTHTQLQTYMHVTHCTLHIPGQGRRHSCRVGLSVEELIIIILFLVDLCDCKLLDHKIWHEDAYISLLIEADYKLIIFCQKLKKIL